MDLERINIEPVHVKTSSHLFYMKCPACLKLYVVDRNAIHTAQPRFECELCLTQFELSHSIESLMDFVPVEELVPTQKIQETGFGGEKKTCPQCGHYNLLSSTECASCQIVFKKWIKPSTEELRPKNLAVHSLEAHWAQILENFENQNMHEQFIVRCQKNGELSWALQRYRDLEALTVGDEVCQALCQNMVQKILTLKIKSSESERYKSSQRTRNRYLYWSVLAIALVCVLLGIFSSSLRNLLGLGLAIWALCYGLAYSVRGSVSLKDFLDID